MKAEEKLTVQAKLRNTFCFCKKNKKDDQDDDIVLNYYSSGESDTEFEIPYQSLVEHDKRDRVAYLWNRAFLKSKGAAHILAKFGELNKKIYYYGAAKKY